MKSGVYIEESFSLFIVAASLKYFVLTSKGWEVSNPGQTRRFFCASGDVALCQITSVLWCCWLGGRKGIRPVETEWWGASVVICLEGGADLHVAQLMPLPLTVSCFIKIQIGFISLVPADPGSPGQMAFKRVCICVCVYFYKSLHIWDVCNGLQAAMVWVWVSLEWASAPTLGSRSSEYSSRRWLRAERPHAMAGLYHLSPSFVTESTETVFQIIGVTDVFACLRLCWVNNNVPSVLWHCWLGGRKGIRRVKNTVVGCWRGYLSGARCRLAYGPADATATHYVLLQ